MLIRVHGFYGSILALLICLECMRFFNLRVFGALLLDRKGGGEMVQNRFKRLFLPLIILSHPVYLLSVTGEKYAESVINEN